MSLNLDAARSYNRRRRYSSQASRVIQRVVGVNPDGDIGSQTTRAIYAWQLSPNRMQPLTADGMLGPQSLGVMIGELLRAGQNSDAVVLLEYPAVLPPGVTPPPGSTVNPILEFRAITTLPIGIRPLHRGGATDTHFGGAFKVILRFNPSVDCQRYEYRQFIRGSASSQPGAFTGTPSIASWHSTGPLHPENAAFSLPSGSLSSSLREDGIRRGSRVLRFGYRSQRPFHSRDEEDRYLPDQATGCEYRLRDRYGLTAPGHPVGLRMNLQLTWQGAVIDTEDHNRKIATLHWGVDNFAIVH